jgi:hypothetical protein
VSSSFTAPTAESRAEFVQYVNDAGVGYSGQDKAKIQRFVNAFSYLLENERQLVLFLKVFPDALNRMGIYVARKSLLRNESDLKRLEGEILYRFSDVQLSKLQRKVSNAEKFKHNNT